MSLVARFFGAGNDLDRGALPDGSAEILEVWVARWEERRGPAFLPRQHRGVVSWYGLTDDAPQRRELETLLHHWVGPTYSDVNERRGALDPKDPFDAWLASELLGRVVRLDVVTPAGATSATVLATVRRRLARLVATLDARPEATATTVMSLGAALDDVYLRAADGDADGALEQVAALEARRLLDAPNTAFVRLRALALAGEDRRLIESQDLRDLQGQRLPQGLAEAVAAADARVGGSDSRPTPQVRAAIAQIAKRPAAASDPVADVAVPPASPDGATVDGAEERIDATLDAVAATPPQTLDVEAAPDAVTELPTAVLDGATAMRLWSEGHLLDLIARAGEDGVPQSALELALVAAEAVGTTDAATKALAAATAGLGPLDGVAWKLPFVARTVDALLVLRDGRISSWRDWFELTAEGRTPEAAVIEDAVSWDPLPADEVVERVRGVPQEALGTVLGSFLACHYEDLEASVRGQIAPHLVETLALSGRSGRDVRSWTLTLVSDALDADLGAAERTNVIDVAELVISQHSNGATIPWLIDLVGEIADAWSSIATSEVDRLVHAALDSLRQVRSSLTLDDVRALEHALATSHLSVPEDLRVQASEVEEGDPLGCYAGKKVLIYSLRERSARQAAARLRDVPGVEVSLSHAHTGTTQLAGQVAGADVVVVVTAAAKHTATNFIEALRPTGVIRVNSAGASGLLSRLVQAC